MSSPVAPLSEPKIVAIGDIHPSPRNPRKIPERAVEVVAASLREFGWQQPIVVLPDGEILAGHTRYRAAKRLKLRKVPVVEFTGTEEQARAFRIADNRTGDYSTWDFAALAEELNDLGDGFADVLGLADWDSIMADFNARTAAAGLADAELAAAGSGGFDLVVTFPTKEAALEASVKMFELGASDVRHKLG